ncbi:CopG family transcriptional regulator [Candidatus Desantisbacteria bacterium CG_4_10_14_0_8_um_filter_48_22]|uniref:CopG family transcriptional regulator n=1 Tax=Candidatus Desantisbacteria bacterium CG_4_10_14_0_8_um_filter_48_22 TaxID=1974543 RepID=A0A2M7S811_9BACT|nr:MAG: CopG family transcriptional regulator [Candidatus Desantisbacteria bacterium CG1_02_49_89]PIV56741.1 MAG: CopG family transcriptional regulator [Candidatus Desantisbacteria bacterium CG02_land_8_20_14_3_00_49_13]PIZ15634.1 MAG: CopG family transcriptional regulator [Candidatus Desantisbacteria bacterium CG_4_10_14_0_8_um_filter_48_22]PJB27313.1 MAG: CopG family transcriptional regulator [Candidatus Desantisbacteria bacterium CG_4_9_14_3_um_filter_50_7]
MPKTITLRLSEEAYEEFAAGAKLDNRPISNFIETMALRHIEESSLIDPAEMAEIKANKSLMKKLERGHSQAKALKGKFV